MDETAQRVQTALAGMNSDYELIEIDPEMADTVKFCEHYGYSLDESANAILVASKRPPGHVALCLALATTRLDVNKRVRELMDVKKLSFASADDTITHTGMMIGGVTPFGLPGDIPIYVDRRIVESSRVIVGGGDRSTKIRVDPAVFTRMDNVEIIEDLAVPFPGDPS